MADRPSCMSGALHFGHLPPEYWSVDEDFDGDTDIPVRVNRCGELYLDCDQTELGTVSHWYFRSSPALQPHPSEPPTDNTIPSVGAGGETLNAVLVPIRDVLASIREALPPQDDVVLGQYLRANCRDFIETWVIRLKQSYEIRVFHPLAGMQSAIMRPLDVNHENLAKEINTWADSRMPAFIRVDADNG